MVSESTPQNNTLELVALSKHYSATSIAVDQIDLKVPTNHYCCLLGPSGCGKTTVLRCLNRMNDMIPTFRLEGYVHFLGTDIYADRETHAGVTPFEPNSAMVFVPSDRTWHGFEKRPIRGVRRSLIINYVKPEWRSRHELAFPDQPVRQA